MVDMFPQNILLMDKAIQFSGSAQRGTVMFCITQKSLLPTDSHLSCCGTALSSPAILCSLAKCPNAALSVTASSSLQADAPPIEIASCWSAGT